MPTKKDIRPLDVKFRDFGLTIQRLEVLNSKVQKFLSDGERDERGYEVPVRNKLVAIASKIGAFKTNSDSMIKAVEKILGVDKEENKED